jgi:hypothetical protein
MAHARGRVDIEQIDRVVVDRHRAVLSVGREINALRQNTALILERIKQRRKGSVFGMKCGGKIGSEGSAGGCAMRVRTAKARNGNCCQCMARLYFRSPKAKSDEGCQKFVRRRKTHQVIEHLADDERRGRDAVESKRHDRTDRGELKPWCDGRGASRSQPENVCIRFEFTRHSSQTP